MEIGDLLDDQVPYGQDSKHSRGTQDLYGLDRDQRDQDRAHVDEGLPVEDVEHQIDAKYTYHAISSRSLSIDRSQAFVRLGDGDRSMCHK